MEQQIPATNSSLAAALLDSQPRANPDAHRVKGESLLQTLHYFALLCFFQTRCILSILKLFATEHKSTQLEVTKEFLALSQFRL